MSNDLAIRKQALEQAIRNAAQRSGSAAFELRMRKQYEVALAIIQHLELQAQREVLLDWGKK